MKSFLLLIRNFLDLFFPNTCKVCGKNLLRQERVICTRCLYNMPKTNYHKNKDNPVAQLFWGRVNIENATSLFAFRKGSSYQKLIYQLKYHGQKEIGFEMGKLLGSYLKNSEFNNVDCIVPVPLHRKKEKKRGFNQSLIIAEGISYILNKPIEKDDLIRKVDTDTQTKKSRYDRWENVEDIFHLKSNVDIDGKHILLVDDVVTTGSTLDACAQTIMKNKDVKISIATLAVAQ